MKVSVVTISYNQSEFIEQAINSIINQDYQEIEYIIVDAGSTDRSREIIKKYSGRISSVIFEPDNGPAEGLNKGFKAATGSIYGFLNSDDFLLPGTIKKVVDFFEKNKDIDIVSGDAILVNKDNIHIRKLHSDCISLLRYAYGANSIVQQSTFFRRSIFHHVGGFNSHNCCAWDGELFVDMALAGGRFSVVHDFWSCFRSHPDAITSSARLDDDIRQYNMRIFRKIMKRDFAKSDHILKWYFRIVKHLLNPRGVIERLKSGPVYGRHRSRHN